MSPLEGSLNLQTARVHGEPVPACKRNGNDGMQALSDLVLGVPEVGLESGPVADKACESASLFAPESQWFHGEREKFGTDLLHGGAVFRVLVLLRLLCLGSLRESFVFGKTRRGQRILYGF